MSEFITFLLAVVGYAGLTAANVLASVRPGRPSRRLLYATAAIVLTHVVLVWTVRYDWQFSRATRNGVAGFLIFHTALVLILWAAFANARLAERLVRIAFPIITLGAVGAVFADPAAERFRAAVLALAACGLLGIAVSFAQRLRRKAVA